MPSLGGPGRRVAIIAGVRTPFARAGTVLKDLSAIELGKRCVAELMQRTNLDGDRGRGDRLRHRRPCGDRAEHRARSLADADAAEGVRGVHGQPRLRVGQSGDHRLPPTRSCSGITTSSSPAARSRCRTCRSSTRARCRTSSSRCRARRARWRSARSPRVDPPARPRADHAGDRRAVDRRDDGAVGREDGEDQPHSARGAGSVRAALASPRGRRHGGRQAHGGDRAGLSCRRATRRCSRATTAFAPTRRSSSSARSSRCSTAGTAR